MSVRDLDTGGPRILYRDDDLLVVDKPAGMLAHPVARAGPATLADWLRPHCADGVHLVGRLDRDTSGVVLVARRPEVKRRLDRGLARIRREYLAVVTGMPHPAEGVVDAPIGRDPSDPPLRAVVPDGVPARTRYRVLREVPAGALVELELETGRTHQIRVHMAHLGHPLIGDRWYGRRGLELIGRQALHAHRVAFTLLDGRPVVVESPVPRDFARLLTTAER